jgi:hypothetical protein
MRPLRVAFAACVLFAAPAALLAQTAQQPAPSQHPVVQPIPGTRPRPTPTRPRPNNRLRQSTGYPVIIDSSVVNRFLGTPSPTPQHKPTPKPRPTNYHGQDVFETHSTEDNAR